MQATLGVRGRCVETNDSHSRVRSAHNAQAFEECRTVLCSRQPFIDLAPGRDDKIRRAASTQKCSIRREKLWRASLPSFKDGTRTPVKVVEDRPPLIATHEINRARANLRAFAEPQTALRARRILDRACSEVVWGEQERRPGLSNDSGTIALRCRGDRTTNPTNDNTSPAFAPMVVLEEKRRPARRKRKSPERDTNPGERTRVERDKGGASKRDRRRPWQPCCDHHEKKRDGQGERQLHARARLCERIHVAIHDLPRVREIDGKVG